MNTVTNLIDVPINIIEENIMSVLYANINTIFSQDTLFNKVLEDKYDGQDSSQIHLDFKSKFLFVLIMLIPKKYEDDIKISKENGIYWVQCVSVSESEEPSKFSICDKSIIQPIIDYAHMYNYIYNINQNDFINWLDPCDGNTIFHELVLYQNKFLIEKLLLQDKFNFNAKNRHGKTPLEMQTSQEILNILNKYLLEKVIFMNEKLKLLEEQNNKEKINYASELTYFKSSVYKNKVISDANIKDIIITKSSNFYQNYRIYIFSSLICLMVIKYFI